MFRFHCPGTPTRRVLALEMHVERVMQHFVKIRVQPNTQLKNTPVPQTGLQTLSLSM